MNKKELVKKITDVLNKNDFRKPVATQRTVFHISDDNGNTSDFVIRKEGTSLLLTKRDVVAVLDAMVEVIKDSIKRGEDVSIHGFGTLGVKYRAARRTKHPETGEDITIKERYVPKFDFGNGLRTAARLFEMSLEEDRGDADANGDK